MTKLPLPALFAILACSLFPTRVLRADLVGPSAQPNPFQEKIPSPDEAKSAARDNIFKSPNQKNSGLIRARMETASAAYAAGNISEAEKVLKATVKDYPTEPTVQVSLARFYYAQRRYNEADAALQAALKLKQSAFLYMDLGTLYSEGLNRPVEAVDYFYKAAAQDPKLPGAHYALGQLLSKLGQFDQARKEFSEAATLDPKNPLPLLGLARLEVQARQGKSAVQAYGKALRLAPNNAALLTEVADLYASLARPKDALKSYTQASERAPADPLVWTKLGMYFQTQGDPIAADRAYEKAQKLDPHSAIVLNNRAAIALDGSGGLENALQWSREATALSPKNAYFLDTYGTVLHRAGKLKEAKGVLEKAVAADPRYPSARYHLALVDKDLELTDDTTSLLKDALASTQPFPERKLAEEMLAKLSGKTSGR